MGMEHTSALVIGYVFDREDLDDRFLVCVPAVTHGEFRYDEFTGERRRVSIVDEDEKFVYRATVDANGTTVEAESCDEFLELVFSDHVVTSHGDFYNGSIVYAVEPVSDRVNDDESYTLKEIVGLMAKCDRIRETALAKLNMEIGEPRVMSLSSYG